MLALFHTQDLTDKGVEVSRIITPSAIAWDSPRILFTHFSGPRLATQRRQEEEELAH